MIADNAFVGMENNRRTEDNAGNLNRVGKIVRERLPTTCVETVNTFFASGQQSRCCTGRKPRVAVTAFWYFGCSLSRNRQADVYRNDNCVSDAFLSVVDPCVLACGLFGLFEMTSGCKTERGRLLRRKMEGILLQGSIMLSCVILLG